MAPLAVTRRMTAGAMHSTIKSDAMSVQRTSSRRVYSFTLFASRSRVCGQPVAHVLRPLRYERRRVRPAVDGPELGQPVVLAARVVGDLGGVRPGRGGHELDHRLRRVLRHGAAVLRGPVLRGLD